MVKPTGGREEWGFETVGIWNWWGLGTMGTWNCGDLELKTEFGRLDFACHSEASVRRFLWCWGHLTGVWVEIPEQPEC